MGALFSAPSKAEEKDQLCEQCKTVWPDRTKDPEKFKREYSRFRDEAGERDAKTRRSGASKGAARLLGPPKKVRDKDKFTAGLEPFLMISMKMRLISLSKDEITDHS